MSCEEFQELISGSLDGSLSPFEEKRLAEHLKTCPECRALADDLHKIRQAFEALPVMAPPADLAQRINDAIAADKITPLPEQRGKRSHWKQWAASAAVFALVILGAGTFRSRAPDPAPQPMTASVAEADPGQPQAAAEMPATFAMEEGPQPRIIDEAPALLPPEQQILELCAETLYPDAPTVYDPEDKTLTVTLPDGEDITMTCTELHPDGISTVELTREDGSSEFYRTDLADQLVTSAC